MLHEMEEGDVKAVHRTRVASRRLRELLPVLQLDPDVLRKLSRRLRKVTGRLGTVRELDVLVGVLDELGKAGRHPQQALAQVAATIDEERRRKRERLLAKGQLRELRRVGDKLEKVARTLEKQDLRERPTAAAPNSDRGSGPSTHGLRAARPHLPRPSPGPVLCICPNGCTPCGSRSRNCGMRWSSRPRSRR